MEEIVAELDQAQVNNQMELLGTSGQIIRVVIIKEKCENTRGIQLRMGHFAFK